MRKKLIIAGVLFLVMALLVTTLPACKAGPAEAKTVKMASLLSLSGAAAGWGVALEEGARWAVDEVNEQGGLLIGKDKYMIDYKAFDDEYSGSVTATQAARIADAGIHYVYGPLSYDGERSGAPIFQAGKTFSAGMSASEYLKEAVPKGYTYFMNFSYPERGWFGTLLESAVQVNPWMKGKYMIQVNPDDDFGHGSAAAITAAANRLGIGKLEDVFYAPGTTDFYPVLTPIVKKNPDVVNTAHSWPSDWPLQVKQLRELGYKGKILSDSADWNTLTSIAGLANVEGVGYANTDYGAAVWPQGIRDLNALYFKRYPNKKVLEFVTLLAHEGMLVYFQGMQKAGSTDPEKVLKVFDDPNFTFKNWGEDGQQLGGIQTYGARRQQQNWQGYAEIEKGVLVQKFGKKVLTP